MSENTIPATDTESPILSVRDLSVEFSSRPGLGKAKKIRAVREVSFDVNRGETFAIVGESGSGKSTTARAIMRLIPAATGSVMLDGTDLLKLNNSAMRKMRRKVQMVFQDPYSSLDPSSSIADSFEEALRLHTKLGRQQRLKRAQDLLERVGMPRKAIERFPHEFSGGQRQRIAIARALSVDPDLLVADEAVSALDVSTQNQVIMLLEELQKEFGTAILFIAHDLAVVQHIAHRTMVMYSGEAVEVGETGKLFTSPTHPYTEALLSAVPSPNPHIQRTRERIVLQGDVPAPSLERTSCGFASRCPYVMDRCKVERPPHYQLPGGGTSECFLHVDGPELEGRTVLTLTPTRAAAA